MVVTSSLTLVVRKSAIHGSGEQVQKKSKCGLRRRILLPRSSCRCVFKANQFSIISIELHEEHSSKMPAPSASTSPPSTKCLYPPLNLLSKGYQTFPRQSRRPLCQDRDTFARDAEDHSMGTPSSPSFPPPPSPLVPTKTKQMMRTRSI